MHKFGIYIAMLLHFRILFNEKILNCNISRTNDGDKIAGAYRRDQHGSGSRGRGAGMETKGEGGSSEKTGGGEDAAKGKDGADK